MLHHPVLLLAVILSGEGAVIATADLTGIALIITAVATPFVTIAVVLIGQRRIATQVGEAADKIDKVHQEVRTMNEGTVGSFAAEDETRRIEAIPHDSRTPTEQRHIDMAPEPEPPIGTSR